MPAVLAGRVALVTGGGRGIGREWRCGSREEGATVAVAARTRDEIDEVARECGDASDRDHPRRDR